MTSSVTIVHVLPGLLGTYGDAGNEITLAYRLRARDIPAEVVRVDAGRAVPETGDIYLIGGGEDRAQALAIDLIGDGLARAAARGATVFGVCAGLQILGTSVTDSAGTTYSGLGLLDITTQPMPQRAVGEVVADCSLAQIGRMVGFENHRGGSRIGRDAQPLATVVRGVGNYLSPGAEGAMTGRVMGTYLHGPVLALNPALADHLLAAAAGDLPPIDDEFAVRARESRLRIA